MVNFSFKLDFFAREELPSETTSGLAKFSFRQEFFAREELPSETTTEFVNLGSFSELCSSSKTQTQQERQSETKTQLNITKTPGQKLKLTWRILVSNGIC